MPHKLPNDLTLRSLGNKEISGKFWNWGQICFKNKNLVIAQENLTKSATKLSTNVLLYNLSCEGLFEKTVWI